MTRDTTHKPNAIRCGAATCLTFAAAAMAQAPFAPSTAEARFVAQLEQAPPEQIQAMYIACSNEAEQRLLATGEAALCSIVYETLKRRVFGDDFGALWAWSRAQPSPQAGRPAASPVPAASTR